MLDDGRTVVIEVEELRSGVVTGDGRAAGVLKHAYGTLEGALRRIGPVTAAAFAQLRNMAEPPDEIDIEFGVKLSADVGAIIARTGGEANFQISLRCPRS